MQSISLQNIILRFKWRISFTLLLVVLEAVLNILYPLLIGLAINDLLEDKYRGIIHLSILGGASLVVGAARRFYDTRIYAKIYSQITPEMVETEFKKDSSVSKVSARSSLLTEFVEFLENSMPEVVGGLISLIGIISIIATLNLNVFYGCIALLTLIIAVYTLTGQLNFKLNSQYNNQLEKQVEALESKDSVLIKKHFTDLMKWNIKLSDLETVNFSIIWAGAIALFLFAPITIISSGVIKYGLVVSVLLYVFEYIENVGTFPLHIQQLIRLKEITHRLADVQGRVED